MTTVTIFDFLWVVFAVVVIVVHFALDSRSEQVLEREITELKKEQEELVSLRDDIEAMLAWPNPADTPDVE